MVFGKKCVVVSAKVETGKDNKAFGKVMLSDGKDSLELDCDANLVNGLQPFVEYDCFVEISTRIFGSQAYNIRRLVQIREAARAQQ